MKREKFVELCYEYAELRDVRFVKVIRKRRLTAVFEDRDGSYYHVDSSEIERVIEEAKFDREMIELMTGFRIS